MRREMDGKVVIERTVDMYIKKGVKGILDVDVVVWESESAK
jgi:hypothetical protein